MRIIQLTDCHLMTDPAAELKGIRIRALWDATLAAVRSQQAAADRLILTGDLTHDELPSTYAALADMLADWGTRLRVLPGNHDDRAALTAAFRHAVPHVGERVVFAEAVAGWQLIGLDSHVPGAVHGELGAAQLAWLADRLNAHPDLPVCLFVHHPPLLMPSAWLQPIGLLDRDALLAVLADHPCAVTVVAGHVHQEVTVVERGVTILTTPATGVQFRPEADVLEVDGVWPGYRVIDLLPDGQLRTRVARVPLEAAWRA